ncbi:MAG: trehalose-6-phosphate synthase [Acidimicrobiales bacterium]|nr:trehalose-6-phosphate synthase [Acidimicrobiales bacterium]
MDAESQGSGEHQLVVVANRLPANRIDGQWHASPGGLVRAMLGVLRSRRGAWIGWSGDIESSPAASETTETSEVINTIDPVSAAELDLAEIEMVSVPLDADDFLHYYERVSNGALWPLFHDAIRESTFDAESWAVYQDVNRRFAEAAASAAAPGATVWVHDYHLLLVPAMLRELRPDVVIGFFLHIPFPPQELFMRMPWREEILAGLLGADVLGFQRSVGADNFIALAKRLSAAQPDEHGVRINGESLGDGRLVRVGTFPISIDVDEIARIARSPETKARAATIRARLGEPSTIFLGVDRLDYTKGIDLRLTSFGALLDEIGVERLDRAPVVLIQIAVPGREGVDSYVEERHTVEQLVGEVNGSHATIGFPVVHYIRRNLPLEELVALYVAADIMLVTPRRDGMNLVAKEFVAARLDDSGVLILSEFAGASDELTQAVLVNPHDPDAIVAAMREAMAMRAPVAGHRMRELRRYVAAHTVDTWAASFLDALGHPPPHDTSPHLVGADHG